MWHRVQQCQRVVGVPDHLGDLPSQQEQWQSTAGLALWEVAQHNPGDDHTREQLEGSQDGVGPDQAEGSVEHLQDG